MGTAYLLLPLTLLATLALPQQALSPADQAAAFRAAGFKLEGRQWKACGDPGTAGYMPGAIERVVDLNGDGRPEAVITEGSGYCFGMTGTGYAIVGKQADGSWKRIAQGPGIVTVLATRSAGGWADIEIGGPGFCFPVLRWNGRAYVRVRHEYEGKPCRPGN
ncbi:MAG: hypothetical protein MT490_13045 [Sphingomonas sp.]|uniref:hypothetical protein n=1 Tax=Sphingomonas sp. TaxID=28214 RepID=UPI00227568E4|nr:hypothetical protein [Sphingomonas sp.]MCX8476719.1 hypothetical protein [Sphingomonas sp.]